METGSVNQEFNIAEILRYAPKMLELFSPIYGEVYFDYVNEEGTDIRVKTKLCGGSVATFNANGTFYDLPNSECLLFPSTHCRTWQHWQNTLFLESIGSVCVDTITGNKFILGKDGTYFGDNTGGYYSVIIENDLGNYLLNSVYASQSQTKEFFEELDKNGYQWDGKMVVKKKFKVCDWIVNDYCAGKVIALTDDAYLLDTEQSIPFSYEHNAHLWTIDDAKDGDVLVDVYGNIGIFQKNDDFDWSSYCSLGPNGGFRCFAINHELDGSHPATKEQRDLLFKKMKEEGYEWNDDTKKLIKTTIPIPKFKEGDWIVDNCNNVWQVVEVSNNFYRLKNINEFEPLPKIKWVDETFYLWSVKNAKDGDVLYSLDSKQPFIFKHRKPNEQAAVYCGINTYGKFFIGNTKDCVITTDKYIPADKFQRDLLFKKIEEAGYQWDAKNKELKLLISNGGDFESNNSKQKPTWNEENS